MHVRPAVEADFSAVYQIEQQAHFHAWPESVLRRYFSREHCVWVLENNNQVIAYAVITLVAGESELLMIAVDPKQQGQGAGRVLMNALHDFLQEQQAEQWFLEVRESNHKAIALYESMGFCQAGCRRNYYPTASGHEDALLYCLELQA